MKKVNQELSRIFYEMADILEMQDVEWKPQAYRRVAKVLETFVDDIEQVYKKSGVKGLMEIQGIGENIANKIEEYIKTGKIKAYERLKKSVPAHLNLLMNIKGMGAKRVKKLSKILNIKSIEQLKKAAEQHKIAKIPGFGLKSEQEILKNIELSKTQKNRISLKRAEKVANSIIKELKNLKEVKEVSEAGSLRRKRETIGDIDILASSNQPKEVIDKFTKLKIIKRVLAKGQTKAMIITKSGEQVDLRVLKPESWGAGLFYFTGSKAYNIETRKTAIKKGYKLNEYGLFNKRGKNIASRTEKEICNKLGIKYLKPEQREV